MKSLYTHIIGWFLLLPCYVYGAPAGSSDSARNFLNQAPLEERKNGPTSQALRLITHDANNVDFQEGGFEALSSVKQPVVDHRDPEAVWIDEFVKTVIGPDSLRTDLRKILSHKDRPFKKSDYRSADRKVTQAVKKALKKLKSENVSINDARVESLMLYLDGYTTIYFEGDKLYGDRLNSIIRALGFYSTMIDFAYPVDAYGHPVVAWGRGKEAYLKILSGILTNKYLPEVDFDRFMKGVNELVHQFGNHYRPANHIYGVVHDYYYALELERFFLQEVKQLMSFYTVLAKSAFSEYSEGCRDCFLIRYVQSHFGEIYQAMDLFAYVLNETYDPKQGVMVMDEQIRMFQLLGDWSSMVSNGFKVNLDYLVKKILDRVNSYEEGVDYEIWEKNKKNVARIFREQYLYLRRVDGNMSAYHDFCGRDGYFHYYCDLVVDNE